MVVLRKKHQNKLFKQEIKINIFYLDKSPQIAACYHCDKHVIKMILESAQLLSSAHRILDGEKRLIANEKGRFITRYVLPSPELNEHLYRATHINHPCAVWVRESREHYLWVYELMIELNNEFVRRYQKKEDHLTIRKLKHLLENPPQNIPNTAFIEPPRCMPEKYHMDDVVLSYQAYYVGAKSGIASWTNTQPPYWFSSKQ